ncbi:MAG: hypothetical protein GF309_10515 [Candidatus Lokiarchaeota archaeon]|nr:hypothetical protein [Candidatus Lokiarchaeota archaeon]
MASESPSMFKCPVCNANVKVGPDDVIITCTYCGSTTTIEGKEVGDHLMQVGVPAEKRVERFRKFLDDNKGINTALVTDSKVAENTIIFVPVWSTNVKADSWYKGYKTVQVPVERQETYTDSDGNRRTRTRTEYKTGYVPVQDEIHTNTTERLLARKGARTYGLEQYLDKIELKDTEQYNFEKIKDLEPDILNAEIGQDEFETAMHGRVADRHREQARSGLTELFDCRTETSISGTTYLQAPFALIRYKFEGDLYKCAIDGHSGDVVLGEIPITKAQRALWTIVGLIGTVIGGAGGQFAYWGFLFDTTNFLLGGILAAIVGVVMAFFGFRTLLMTQREKEG